VETLPALVNAGVVVQEVIPAVPEIDQVVVPVGATPPLPVTVSVKIIVELRVAPPELTKVTVGTTLDITTFSGLVAASEV